MKRRRVLTCTGCILPALLGGCVSRSSPPPVDAVEVSVVDIRSPDLGVRTATIPTVLEFSNPSSSPVPSPQISFEMVVEGTEVASSHASLGTIDAGESVVKPIDIVVQYGDLAESAVESLRSGAPAVEIRGELASEGATSQFRVTSDL